MNEQLVFEVFPNYADERSQTMSLSPTTWKYARLLCAERGYDPPADSLSGRYNVRHLVRLLREGLECIGKVETQARSTCRRFAVPAGANQQKRQSPTHYFAEPAARKELLALIDYLENDGAAGFSLRRRWRRAADRS